MPFLGAKAVHGQQWALHDLPFGAVVTVTTINKNSKVAELDYFPPVDGAGTVTGTVWKDSMRMHIRIAAVNGGDKIRDVRFACDGNETIVSGGDATDLSIVVDS